MDLVDEMKQLKETGIAGVEKMGMLVDLDELQKIEIAHHIINAANILDEENMFDIKIQSAQDPPTFFYMYVIPAIRRMMTLLLEKKSVTFRSPSGAQLLEIFDERDFIFYLNDMIQHVEKMNFLNHLDYEMEFLKLVCENYIPILEKKYYKKTD